MEIHKKGLRIQWGIETRIDILNIEIISLMASAGLKSINIGIETPNELIDILKNPKHPRHKKTIDALFNRNEYTHRHHFLPQSKWLKTYKDQTIIICYHAQNLNKNLQEAFIKHDIHCPIEKLPIINQSITPLRQRKNNLSLENVQWLKATYDDDFKLWQQYCGD